jgi:hypothetical protein
MSIHQQIEAPTPNGQSMTSAQPIQLPQAPAPVSDALALLQTIERAALNPEVDVEKMDRLWNMYERIQGQRSAQEFAAAMCDAQSDMEPIRANCDNKSTQSRYADYSALDRAIRPIYTKHGFSLSFNTGDNASEGYIMMLCDVSHRNGFVKSFRLPMPADGMGAKGNAVMTRTHATGSAVSYGKRNLAGMIFNLSIDKDDDGNAAGATRAATPKFVTKDQAEELLRLADEAQADKVAFCRQGNANSFFEILAVDYAGAKNLLLKRKAAIQAKQTQGGAR